MSPALWGAVTALGWGSADFIARYTGGRLGLVTALAGMMSASALLLIAFAVAVGMPLVIGTQALGALALAAAGIVTGTLLLYWALVRGPIAVASPIVASYPAVNLAIAVAEGLRPGADDWAAMAAVMLGVLIVARFAAAPEEGVAARRGGLRLTVLIALGSAFAFAFGIHGMQGAQVVYGELQVLIVVRLTGALAAILALLALPGERRRVPASWWPLLALQGLLDGGAYLALMAGSRGEDAAIAVVVASTFCIVPVLLARLVLRERVTTPQAAGILTVVAGVAYLSA